MTSTVAEICPGASARHQRSGTAIEIADDLAAVAALWRSLEPDAVMAPYGRYDWIAAYQGALPSGAGHTHVAVQRGPGGEVVFLQAFQLERRHGLTVAHAIGGRHANYNLPLVRAELAAALTPESARALMVEAGRALGADLIDIRNAPVAWEGAPNPFAAMGRPAADAAWATHLEADGEATIARVMGGEARKKMRSKHRSMEKLGEVRLLHSSAPAEVDRLLAAYFTQKQERFAELGICDPFADPAMRDFLRRAATDRLATGAPAVEFYGLEVGGEIAAVIGGAVDRHRFSGMVLSFGAVAFGKFSPGEQLLLKVIPDLCRRGFRTFDLGVGDARYKRAVCDQRESLVDITLPLTWKGQVAAELLRASAEAKRRLKASPRAMKAIGQIRKGLAALRR